jgi:hypothetical protein
MAAEVKMHDSSYAAMKNAAHGVEDRTQSEPAKELLSNATPHHSHSAA